jgi:hypothetical protein
LHKLGSSNTLTCSCWPYFRNDSRVKCGKLPPGGRQVSLQQRLEGGRQTDRAGLRYNTVHTAARRWQARSRWMGLQNSVRTHRPMCVDAECSTAEHGICVSEGAHVACM